MYTPERFHVLQFQLTHGLTALSLSLTRCTSVIAYVFLKELRCLWLLTGDAYNEYNKCSVGVTPTC